MRQIISNPDIIIIVHVYNMEKYSKKGLITLVNKTLKNICVIIYINCIHRSGSIVKIFNERLYHYIDNWSGVVEFYKSSKEIYLLTFSRLRMKLLSKVHK